MYSTFTEDMLWASLTQQARVDQTLPEPVSVENITNSWLHTNKHSFPVLTVARNYDENFATLEQVIQIPKRGFYKIYVSGSSCRKTL
jgi:hypothetical protein